MHAMRSVISYRETVQPEDQDDNDDDDDNDDRE